MKWIHPLFMLADNNNPQGMKNVKAKNEEAMSPLFSEKSHQKRMLILIFPANVILA